MQEDNRSLREWRAEALKALNDWNQLGNLLTKMFPLQLGDNIPRELTKQVQATVIVLRKMLNL